MLNGDAHLSETEGEQARIRPVALFSKTKAEGRLPHEHPRLLMLARPKGGCAAGPGDPRRGEGSDALGGHGVRPLHF